MELVSFVDYGRLNLNTFKEELAFIEIPASDGLPGPGDIIMRRATHKDVEAT